MDSPNSLDLTLYFAGCPIALRMGYEDSHMRGKWEVGRHCNADFEVHILLSGSCTLEIDDQRLPFCCSSAVLIPPGIYHYDHKLSAGFERFGFSFISSRKDFTEALRSQINSAAIFSISQGTIALCRLVLEEMTGNGKFREDAIRGLFTQLLVSLFREADLDFIGNTSPVNTVSWRTSIIDAFFSPWPDPFGTEDDLSSMLNLSRRQLNRVLMQSYGMGFRQKMLQARMEYAGNLLRNTDQNAKQIGMLVGYTAESSFFKAFQGFYHMTPQEYRQVHQKTKSTYAPL
jgi:AraC-like DNA-binding protein